MSERTLTSSIKTNALLLSGRILIVKVAGLFKEEGAIRSRAKCRGLADLEKSLFLLFFGGEASNRSRRGGHFFAAAAS